MMFGGVDGSLVSIAEEDVLEDSFSVASARSAKEFFGFDRRAWDLAKVRHLGRH